jgi:hypothetical protein
VQWEGVFLSIRRQENSSAILQGSKRSATILWIETYRALNPLGCPNRFKRLTIYHPCLPLRWPHVLVRRNLVGDNQ